MTGKQDLLNAKKTIEDKIKYNKELLKTIDKIKQDESILTREIKDYKVIIDILNKEIENEQINKMGILKDNQKNNVRIQDISKKIE